MGVCGSKPVAKEEAVVNSKEQEPVKPVREPAKKPPSRIQESVAQNSGRQNVAVDFGSNNSSQTLERKWSRQSSQKSQACFTRLRILLNRSVNKQ